jgi:hypothetical protein
VWPFRRKAQKARPSRLVYYLYDFRTAPAYVRRFKALTPTQPAALAKRGAPRACQARRSRADPNHRTAEGHTASGAVTAPSPADVERVTAAVERAWKLRKRGLAADSEAE